MIKVELELPTISVVALCGWIAFVPPAGLAIFLAAQHYDQTSLQVSAGLLGALLVCLALCTIAMGIYPRRWLVQLIYAANILTTIVSGLYWVSARFNARGISFNTTRIEIACLCLWAVSLLIANNLLAVDVTSHFAKVIPSLVEKPSPNTQEELAGLTESLSDYPSSPSFHVTHKKSVSSLLDIVRSKSSRQTLNETPATGNPLAGLEALPEGFMEGDWDVQSVTNNGRLRWILSQAEPQSRNVSDSSNLTGSLFPATDYNRRISDMGFQKDEPFPLPKVRKQSSFPVAYSERTRLNKSA